MGRGGQRGRSNHRLKPRLFVAGATGAIGRRLVPLLVAKGYEVWGTTRFAAKAAVLREMGAIAVVVDVFDEPSLARAATRASASKARGIWLPPRAPPERAA